MVMTGTLEGAFIAIPPGDFGSTVLAQNVANRRMYLQIQELYLERAMGIEPTSEAWEAPILPLNYARSLF